MNQTIDFYICGKCHKKYSKDEFNNEAEIDDKERKNSKDDDFCFDFCNQCKDSLQTIFLDDDFLKE